MSLLVPLVDTLHANFINTLLETALGWTQYSTIIVSNDISTALFCVLSCFDLHNFRFRLLQNPDGHPFWLESITAIPSDSFNDDFLQPEPIEGAGDYRTQCGTNHFYIDPQVEGIYFTEMQEYWYVNVTVCVTCQVESWFQANKHILQ